MYKILQKNIRVCSILFIALFVFIESDANCTRHFPSGVQEVYIPDVPGVRSALLRNIAPLVEQSINDGLYPGMVIFAAHHGQLIYKGVFGNRRIIPSIAPMTSTTIFDIASLTKVLVTTTAVMQLFERGKLDIDAPASHYWPDFGYNGKAHVTIRQLLTHTSGLPAELCFPKKEFQGLAPIQQEYAHYGKSIAAQAVVATSLERPPGSSFNYSDVNFVALGHLVELISGEDLEHYATEHIFKPLKLQHTFYLPPQRFLDDIAPTEIIHGKLRWGVVHDDTAYIMGGISGMAGIFSDATDLGKFAQCLLDGGRIPDADSPRSKYLLGPLSILKMTTPQTPKHISDLRGLGWDLDSKYSIRGQLFPTQSYGHTGWTGTSIWIDPATQTWIVILTSRTHPRPTPVNCLVHDRKVISNIIAASITDVDTRKLRNTGEGELSRAFGEEKPSCNHDIHHKSHSKLVK